MGCVTPSGRRGAALLCLAARAVPVLLAGAAVLLAADSARAQATAGCG